MKRFSIVFAVAMVCALCAMAIAAVPNQLNLQGVLKDGTGNPVADGSYSVVFTIYDAITGGNVLWTETQSVATTKGLFTTLLGSSTPVPDSTFNGSSRWLGIKVGADPEMTPRQQMASTGYSFVSNQWTSAGQNLFRLNGNVGIGTTTPGARLSIVKSDNLTGDILQIFPQNLTQGIGFAYNQIRGIGSNGNTTLLIDAQSTGNLLLQTSSTGNVGIGTTTPVGKLEVRGVSSGSSEELINLKNSSGAYLGALTATLGTGDGQLLLHQWTGGAGSLGNVRIGATGASYLMGGNLGIGTTTPGDKLEVAGNIKVKLGGAPSISVQSTDPAGHHYGWVSQGVNGSLTLNDFTGGAIRLAVDNVGNLGVGTSAPGFLLEVNGTAGKPGGGSWSASSDIRLKKNVAPIAGALGKMLELRGVTYQWKEPEKEGNMTGTYMGMIAQEVEKVVPEWVGTKPNGFKTLTFIGFEALSVEAVRELYQTTQKQAVEISDLKAQVSELEELRAQVFELQNLVHTLSAELRPTGNGKMAASGEGSVK